MNIIKEGLVSISKGFSCSINIDLDINDPSKIRNYIPTDYTIKLLENILKKPYGANIMIGSYGTGKSHFTTVLSNILRNKLKKEDYKELLEKIDITNKALKMKIETNLNNSSEKLLILPKDNIKDIKSSILVGLKEALERENLENIIPQTSFDAIKNRILDWKENYRTTYESFIEILENEYKIDSEDFINNLNRYNQEVFTIFEEIYPRVTAGSIFSPMHNVNLIDLLKNVNRKIRSNGFEGFVIVFDEFGKYMEQNIKSINLKDIQDIAEYTNDEKESSNLILITHRDLSQYVNTNDKQSIFEWRKVEGRFKKHIFKSDEYQMFDLISKVLIKNKEKWSEFKKNKETQFNELTYNVFSIELFKDMPKDVQSNLIDNLYPLHPGSAYSLIKLSDKLAQNERTTFTFLCSDEENTLSDYIENDESEFPIINIDSIYDFYKDLMKKENSDGEIYLNWQNSRGALNHVRNKDTAKISILKTLAIINIINGEETLKPDDSNIRVLSNLDKESYRNNMQELLRDKILIYRKSIEEYDFYQGSYLDIEEILDQTPSEEYDFIELLEDEFSLIPVLPRKHNDDKKINRIIECNYINKNNITKDISEEEYYKEVSDGKILYYIPSNPKEIEEAKLWVKNQKESLRTIVGIPNDYFEIVDKLNRYEKLKKLIEDEEFLSQDNLLEEEINLYIEDARSEIYNEIRTMTSDSYEYLDLFYKGENLNINNKLELNKKISEIFDELYSSTLIINNEMVNKNNISPTMSRVIRNVIKCYWETENILDTEEFTEFSAEGTFIRTVLKNTGILNDNNVESEVIQEIKSFLEESSLAERKFEDLYKSLKDNPYGVKDGLMPILLAISLKNYSKNIYIYRRGKGEDLNPDIFMEIIKKPSFYTIYTDEWSQEKQRYVEKLEKYFEKTINKDKKESNRLQALYDGIKNEYISLSRFSRSTCKLSENAINTRKLIENEYIDLRKFFFETLTSDNKINYDETYENIINLFREMKIFTEFIEEDLKQFLKETFKIEGNNSISTGLYEWYVQEKHNLSESQIEEGYYNILSNIFLSKPEETKIYQEIVYGLKNFYIEDLNDKMYEDIKNSIVNFVEIVKRNSSTDSYDYKLNSEKNEENITINLEDIDLDFFGSSLLEKIIDDIDSFGESIDKKQRFKVVANLIKKYIE